LDGRAGFLRRRVLRLVTTIAEIPRLPRAYGAATGLLPKQDARS
jgi:hypothetical protein